MEADDSAVTRVPSALHSFNDRLQSGVQSVGRNRDAIKDLTDQVQRIRRRAAENINLGSSLPQIHVELPSLSWSDSKYLRDENPYSNHVSRVDISPPRRGRNRSAGRTDIWSPESHQPRHRSTPRLDYSNDDEKEEIEALYSRLKAELMKTSTLEEMNEMLREENDAALQANEGLRSDVSGLTKALEALDTQSSQDRHRFQAENTRYCNQLENQHRQLINLWKAFTGVKRQVRELHTSTANDLDRQKTEFARCAAMMQRAIKQAEHKNQMVRDEQKKEKDDVVDEVMKKYDVIHVNCMKAEHDLHEKSRLLSKSEHELKRLKEEKRDLENALDRIDNMPELVSGKRRSRSSSPSVAEVAEVMRKIRQALLLQKEAIRQAEEAKERSDAENRRLKKDLENTERQTKEKNEVSRQRNEVTEQKDLKLKDLEAELRRLNDRLTVMVEEKDTREKVFIQLQENITTLHRTHKEFLEDLTSRHREELDTRESQYLGELEERSRELAEKENKLESEMEKLRRELDEAREKWREARADQATQKRVLDEKDMNILQLEEDLRRLKRRLDEEVSRADEHATAITELNGRVENQLIKETEIRMQLAESQNLNSVLNDEIKLLQEQMTDLRTELVEQQERIEQNGQAEQEYQDQLGQKQKEQQEMEDALRNLKNNLQDLEIKLEGTMEEARISREELGGNRDLLESKVRELNEHVRLLEETRREREQLLDELSTVKRNTETQNDQLGRLESELEKRREEDRKNSSLLDDLRMNYDKLVNEIQEKKITITDLKETIESMKAEEKKKEEERKAELLRDEEMDKLKEQEMEVEWKGRLERMTDEKKRAVEEVGMIEGRLKDLTDLHEKLMEEELQLRMQLDEAKEATEEAQNRHKKDVAMLESQNNMDRDEWDKERQQLEKNKSSQMEQLKEELTKAEDDLKEALAREGKLKTELEETREVLEKIEEEKKLAKRNQEMREDDKSKEQRLEEEKRTHNVRIEELHVKLTRSNAQADEAERNRAAVERKLAKVEANLVKKSEDMSALEEKLSSLTDKLAEVRLEEITNRDRLVMLERENGDLKIAKDRVNSRLGEEQKRVTELEDKLRELNRETQGARVVAQKEKETRIGGDEKISVLSSRVKQLEAQLADRQAKTDSTNELLKKVEGDGAHMAQSLRSAKDRANDLQKAKEELERNVKRLTEELEQTRVALERKTATSKQATTDLLTNYREADKRLVETQTECELLRQQLTTLSSRAERAEAKFKETERRLEDSTTRQTELTRRLHHYEQSAKIALHMAKSSTDLRPGVSFVDIPRVGSSGIGESLPRANSTHDLAFFDSRPKPFEDIRDLDLSSSMEITLRYLKERIVQLERDKVALNSESESHKQDARLAQDKLKEAASVLKDVERRLGHLVTEKDQLEHRLASQRQLYLTTEESTRRREGEYKSLRARLATAEIHLREKDSRIAHLATQLEATKLELSSIDCDRQKQTTSVKHREDQIRKLEDERKVLEDEQYRLQKNLRELSEDFKLATKRLDETDAERIRLGKELEDIQKAARRDRDLVEKLQNDERHWRMTAVNVKKSSEDYHKSVYEERIANLQANYDTAMARNNATANEAEKMRQELREYSQKINSLNLKVADVERRAAADREGKTTLSQQLAAFQRIENDWNRLEKEMREELKVLRKDKLSMTSEIEELKRRLTRTEVEKKEIDANRARLDREVAVLRKHLQTLEEEKARTEQAVKDTLAERKAIDKSIAAMERENSELYKNCGQLQTQIHQLEKDSGQRAVAKLLKEQALMEAKLTKLIQEKRHLELVIEQKDSNYSHKKKLLESQLSLLRDQLEAERRRRQNGSGRFERSTDVRMSRTTAVRKDSKGPFREEVVTIEEFRSSNTLTNDISLSIETTF